MTEDKKKNVATKKPAAKKVAAKKVAAKKVAPKKATAKKKAAKKTTTARKNAPRKIASNKAADKATSAAQVTTPDSHQIEPKTPTQFLIAAALKDRAAKTGAAKKPATQEKITIKVQRAEKDDNGGLKTWEDSFEVPYDESTTVLQALEWIKGQKDGTLTFRRSCRASICGSCGMFINNRSRLACKTKVIDLVLGAPDRNRQPATEIVIGPQKNQPVAKDLVIELEPFYNKVKKITPYVQKGEETAKHVDKNSFEQVNLVSNCIMCGLCYSDCTAMVENPDFIGPAALAKAFRFVSDPREGKRTERLRMLSEENGVWDCTRCGMCLDACPKGVDPMEAIVKLRTRAMHAGVTDNKGARHALAFKGDISRWGLLNEPLLLLKTYGPAVVKQMGTALHLAKKGKIPSLLPHKAEGLDEVRAIYKELEKNPIDVETKAEDSGPGAG